MWLDDLKLYDIPRNFLTTKEKKEARKAICIECEHLTAINTCADCHCVMPAKWWLEAAECPKQKW